MNIEDLSIFGLDCQKENKVTAALLQVLKFGGACLLRWVLNKLGTDIVSNEIKRVELQTENTNPNDSFHSRIILNGTTLFLVSKWNGVISSNQHKRNIELLNNKCTLLLYITNSSQSSFENHSEKVLWTNWADWQYWLEEYPTGDAVLQYLIGQFNKLLDSLFLKQKQEKINVSKILHDNNLYYLTDFDKELKLHGAGYDWLSPNHTDHIIWKYMSLEHALDMIEEERLYLANPTKWKDPYESYFMRATYLLENSNKKSYAELFDSPRQLYCTCLTDAFQNDAQWNLYNGEDMAVMIGFDVEKLFAVFSKCRSRLYIGRVNYVEGGWAKARELSDSDKKELRKGNVKAILSLMLRKRVNYAYEQEIRLMCLRKYGDKEKSGVYVSIPGIVNGIVRIRVSPKVGTRTINMIQDYLADKIPKVSRSRLFAKISKKNEIDLNTNNDGQKE